MTHQAFILSLMLARVCVSEGGWNGHDECVVIVNALQAQADQRGISLRRQICAYAPNSCNQERQDRRKWIAHLSPERRRPPPGWPRGMRWEPRRAQFAAMMVVAYRALQGEISNPCPGALHWGAPWCESCERRMRNSGMVRAGCGLLNYWYRRR